MSVKEIVINSESVDVVVISDSNGIKNIYQLDLEPQENEIKKIFEENNLSEIINYPFDPKIVQALADNEDQLKDYLDTCRKANYSNHKIEIPEDIPYILYDFRDLRDSFKDVDDEKLRINKQLQLYKKAKEMKEILKGKVKLAIGWVNRAFYSIQEFLHRNEQPVLALNPATASRTNEWRESQKVGQNVIQKTNEVHMNINNKEEKQQEDKEEKLIE